MSDFPITFMEYLGSIPKKGANKIQFNKNNFKMETVVTSSTERAKMPFPVIAESNDQLGLVVIFMSEHDHGYVMNPGKTGMEYGHYGVFKSVFDIRHWNIPATMNVEFTNKF